MGDICRGRLSIRVKRLQNEVSGQPHPHQNTHKVTRGAKGEKRLPVNTCFSHTEREGLTPRAQVRAFCHGRRRKGFPVPLERRQAGAAAACEFLVNRQQLFPLPRTGWVVVFDVSSWLRLLPSAV